MRFLQEAGGRRGGQRGAFNSLLMRFQDKGRGKGGGSKKTFNSLLMRFLRRHDLDPDVARAGFQFSPHEIPQLRRSRDNGGRVLAFNSLLMRFLDDPLQEGEGPYPKLSILSS